MFAVTSALTLASKLKKPFLPHIPKVRSEAEALTFSLLLFLSLPRKSDAETSGPMNVVSCPSDVGKRKVFTPMLEFSPIPNPPRAGSEKKLLSDANAGLKLRLILYPSRKYADCSPVWAFNEDNVRMVPARIAIYFFIYS